MNLGRWQRTIVDLAGNVIAGAVITIRRESDQQLVTVYGDKAGEHPYTPTGQATADANGYVYFYVEPGLYRITSSNPAVDWRDVEIGSVEIAQEVDQSWRDFEAQAEYEHDNLRAMLMQSRYGDGPYPTIDWQFAGASRLDPRISFSRASADTIYDASGKLVTLGNDVPAFPYDLATGKALGFRVQAQGVNILQGSGVPNSYSKAGYLTPVAETTMSGYTVGYAIPATDNTAHPIDLTVSSVAAEGSVNSAQLVIAPDSFTNLAVQCYSGSSTPILTVSFTFENGRVTGYNQPSGVAISTEELADGLNLIKLEGFVAPAGSNPIRLRVFPQNPTSQFPGDGTSGFYYGGFMWETNAAVCSSYINSPSGSQATRAADSALVLGSSFTDWFNPQSSALLLTARILNISLLPGTSGNLIALSDGSTNNRVQFRAQGNGIKSVIADNGNLLVNTTTSASNGDVVKIGASWSEQSTYVYINGVAVASPGGASPIMDRFNFGETNSPLGSGGDAIFEKFTYYDRALTADQLQALTS